MPECNTPEENALVARARTLMARYDDMAELIRLGAYRKGSDQVTDEAIYYHDALERFLSQAQNDHCDLASGYAQLAALLDGDDS